MENTISYCLLRHAMSLGLLSLDGVLSITSFEQFQRHDATPGCHATAIPCYSHARPSPEPLLRPWIRVCAANSGFQNRANRKQNSPVPKRTIRSVVPKQS